ncbi:MAG: hypothetical protein KDH92_03055 [Chloroflexi bacterium]|nr:hypothetical protein [Chloroflexota bacterium]
MRRATPIAPLLAGLALTMALLAGPPRLAQLRAPAPIPVAPLDIADYTPGQIVEGDGPPMERFAPDAFQAAPRAGIDQSIPAPEGYPVDFRHYPSSEEIAAFLEALEADHPDLVERFEIGRSSQDRPIFALRLTNESGAQAIADRPIAYIDGQHHARELISAQVALYSLWWLLDRYGQDPLATRLLDSRAIHFVPSVNVDGNQIALDQDQTLRRTANPSCCDDDGDGKVDEDPTEGYGYGTDTLSRYTFDQAWADANPDDPFAPGWRQHLIGQPQQLGRFTGALGGPSEPILRLDSDGDGRLDEDPVGGVDANRNYDWHWAEGDMDLRSETYGGPAVWSEPEVRALRDYLAELDTLSLGISYHSGVDLILFPWGHSASEALPDAGMFELLGRKGSQLTEVNGFQGSTRTWTAQGLYAGFGSTMDHLYGNLGAFAFSPEVYGGSSVTRLQRLGASGTFTVGQSTGFGFNPRPEEILASVDRWNRFATYLMAATPNLELNALTVEGAELRIQVGNEGVMPTGLGLRLTGAGEPIALASTESTRIGHGQLEFRVPLDGLRAVGNRLELEAWLASGTRAHRIERDAWTFDLVADGVRLTEGTITPFVELGPQFGGWWAGDEWNDPKYRCPRGPQNCPPQIQVTPPAGASLPTAAPPTATPRVDASAGAFLPWLATGR